MEMGSMGEAKTWLWRLEIRGWRSEEHTSELQSHYSISYAVFEGETDNLRKTFSDGFQKSLNSTPTRFSLIFLIIPTHQSVKKNIVNFCNY